MTLHPRYLAPVFALGLGLAGAAQAESKTATMDVRARFNENCAVSAPALDFGEMKRMSMNRAIVLQGKLVVDCSERVVYRVALDAGLHYDAATPQNRRLAGPNGAYSLYTVLLPASGGGGPIWGDSGLGNTLTAGSPFLGTGSGVVSEYAFTTVAFGAVLGNGSANGNYTDTLTMTLDY